MIIDALIAGVLGIVGWLIGLLPTGSWSPDVSGLSGVMQQVEGLNTNLPLDTAAAMFALWLGMQGFLIAFTLAQKTWGWIRG